MSRALIHGPEPFVLEGRQGLRYWVHDQFEFSGVPRVDSRLSEFPFCLFLPDGRPREQTPLVVGLQGMCAPLTWNGFLVPAMLDMGIGVALLETPFAGDRSLTRNHRADIVAEIHPLVTEGVSLRSCMLANMMSATSRDIQTVLDVARTRHGIDNDRVALFGISLGTLLTSYAFMRDGLGQRLLGTIGHADLISFARSYTPRFAPLLLALPPKLLRRAGRVIFGRTLAAGYEFLSLLRELSCWSSFCAGINPLLYAHRVSAERRVRFLVGDSDPLVRPGDAQLCARFFTQGACYVVPGMGHGSSEQGPSFIDHVRYYVQTQLGDWAWST